VFSLDSATFRDVNEKEEYSDTEGDDAMSFGELFQQHNEHVFVFSLCLQLTVVVITVWLHYNVMSEVAWYDSLLGHFLTYFLHLRTRE